MKAMVQKKYGPVGVYSLADIEKPVPKDDELLIKVRASSVHADVWHAMIGLPYVLRLMGSGLRRPTQQVPGTDLAGVVEAVGSKVTRFKVGDEVFGETLRGIQWKNGGAWAEYATAPESGMAFKPGHVSFETAAAVPTAGLIALMNLRMQGALEAGHEVLINGAGGGVGTLALQLAMGLGARVTAVDKGEKLAALRDLGASAVIDYEKEDFTKGSARFDLIFDIPGNHSFAQCRKALKPTGIWVLIGHDGYGKGMKRLAGAIPRMMGLMLRSLVDTNLPKTSFAMPDKAIEMELLRDFLERGKLTPKIDRSFHLHEANEAMRFLESGQAIGRIVINI